MQFIQGQADYFTLIALFALAHCAVESLILARAEEPGRRWPSFFAFHLLQALAVSGLLLGPVTEAKTGLVVVFYFLQALSFGSLFAFSAPSGARMRRRRVMLALSVALVAVCVAAGLTLGAAAFFSEKGEHAPSSSPQARVRGVGLSLATVHSIVVGLGGRIDVESTPGAGSVFTVWLPSA